MAIIKGTNAADPELEGTAAADQIFGLGGNDILIGFGGDDILEGGAGADQLFGSPGFDHASYRGSGIGAYASLTDYVGKYGDAEGDELYGIEGLIGSKFGDIFTGGYANDVLKGEGGGDHFAGLDGDDKLDGGAGNDLLEGGAGNDDLRGGSGTDTASFYNYTSGVQADLASGTATGSYTGQDRLYAVENLGGTPYADRLAGNAGANVLDGSFGADVLIGRAGGDRFDYGQTSFSDPNAPDRILDFNRPQGDRIDLSSIDAKQHGDGNEAFRFIGGAAFSGEGQVRCFQQNGDTFIEANVDDTYAGAELRIVLDPLISLRAGDFIL